MQTNTTPTLLQAIRQDPDTGLRWAMRDYAALVRGIARRILPGHDRDIEECTADVFVALWRNAARLEATGTPVRAWLIVTARNTAINCYRALQRHDTLPLTDAIQQGDRRRAGSAGIHRKHPAEPRARPPAPPITGKGLYTWLICIHSGTSLTPCPPRKHR